MTGLQEAVCVYDNAARDVGLDIRYRALKIAGFQDGWDAHAAEITPTHPDQTPALSDLMKLYSDAYTKSFQSGRFVWPQSHEDALQVVADVARATLLAELKSASILKEAKVQDSDQ